MAGGLLLFAVVLIACVFLNQISSRIGIPMLLAFIVLGMIFGSDGIFKIEFENFHFAGDFCTVALIFIIFYGGFGTNWKEAKDVYKRQAISTVSAVIRANTPILRGWEILQSPITGMCRNTTLHFRCV